MCVRVCVCVRVNLCGCTYMCLCVSCRSCLCSFLWFELLVVIANAIAVFRLQYLIPSHLLWPTSCLFLWPSRCVHPFQAASFFASSTSEQITLLSTLRLNPVQLAKLYFDVGGLRLMHILLLWTGLCSVTDLLQRLPNIRALERLSLIHIWRCRRSTTCRSRWSPYH